jgi:hypothetical protein
MSVSTEVTSSPVAAPAPVTDDTAGKPVSFKRRTLDVVAIALGTVVVFVLVVAGALLTWGSNFANDHVRNELTAQQIFFPSEESLVEGGRADLVRYADEQVTSGGEAQAYASYIAGHLEETAGGQTYAQLGAPERAARAEAQAAIDSGASQAQVDELQASADEITNQRNTLFKGETLRGLLLSTYAWSTIGQIAGIAAIVAFVAAGVMFLLVLLGVFHLAKMTKS